MSHLPTGFSPQMPDGGLNKDFGHAAVLAQLFQDRYRWAVHRGRWMRYDGKVWRPIPEERIAKEAAEALRQAYAAQLVIARDKDVITDLTSKVGETCVYARINGALAFLKGWDHILTLPDQWDADPHLLNVANGTLHLDSWTLTPHHPADLLTKLAPVDYDPLAKSRLWDRHINTFLPDPDVRRQVQRDLGLALVGTTLDEVLPFWWGTGANGKSTTAKVLMEVLGDYADRAAPNLLIQGRYERHPTELADLAGKRLVFSVEVDQGKGLAEARVKDLTGGDRKKARHMRQDFFSFEQTFSIVLIVNHKPIVRGTDEGIWRRIRLVPWTEHVAAELRRPQDQVVAELVADGPAILAWLVEGLQDWQMDHWWVAEAVKAATDEYRAEQDVLGEFLAECCIRKPQAQVRKAALYEAYQEWCKDNEEQPATKKSFTKLLGERGIGSERQGHDNVHVYVGVSLRQDATRLSISLIKKSESC